jgi:hypothetical protein
MATVGKLHGTETYCVRADVTPATGPWVTMELPYAGSDVVTAARAIEAFAYRPGYCLARTPSAAEASSIKQFSMGRQLPNIVNTGEETRLDMRRSGQAPDERLMYLQELTAGLLCSRARWSDRSRGAMGLLADAMLGEAREIARSRYEKTLVQQLETGLASVRALPANEQARELPMVMRGEFTDYARDFIVGAADLRVAWDPQRRIAIAAAVSPVQAASPVPPGALMNPIRGIVPNSRPPAPAPLAVHCRHGAPSACDLNERDAQGHTAINTFVAYTKPAELRVLLEAGADPTLPAKPFGPHPIDVALRSMLRMDRSSPERAKRAEIVDILAADPRTTITRALKDDLAADPSAWNLVASLPGLDLLAARREALARLPVRPEGKPGCEPLGFQPTYDEGPVRLRYSQGY